MEHLLEIISNCENNSAVLSGVFGIIGTLLGTVLGFILTQLVMVYQNRPKLIFVGEGTPNDERVEWELRTKTSPSDLSIRICNTGRTPCFLEDFVIIRKGHELVECYGVSNDHSAIAPSCSVLYTLMHQDASALQYNYSKYYKKPSQIYQKAIFLFSKIPIIRNHVIEPQFRQGECKVIAYDIARKKIHGKIDLPILYIRHTTDDSIAEM